MESIWTKTAAMPRFRPLEGDRKTQVLIVGGGMAGLLCAYQLGQAGIDYILAEAGRVCGGVTGNTTAKITAQHGLIYHRLVREFGPEKAGLYLKANLEALDQYRGLCRGIDCDFAEKDAFVYAVNSREKLEQEMEALGRLGFPAELAGELPLPFPVAGAVKFPGQAQFHPLKFAAAIAKGLNIFEGTKVLGLTPGGAETSGGKIRAEKVIIATHFPILNKHGGYFLKLYQNRSYVLALENAPDLQGMYLDEAERGLSFRNAGGLLLIGGGSGRTGKKGSGWQEPEAFARRYYPHAREAARWAAQDCMSLDGVPYIGRYAKAVPELYVASGFNKWGMTGAMTAARLLTDMVLGRDSPYAPVFAPSRGVLRPQLAANIWEAAVSLLTPTRPRCPHMGCALRYNPQERSWDCPCHGSRFGEDGKLLDNPATDGKQTGKLFQK